MVVLEQMGLRAEPAESALHLQWVREATDPQKYDSRGMEGGIISAVGVELHGRSRAGERLVKLTWR